MRESANWLSGRFDIGRWIAKPDTPMDPGHRMFDLNLQCARNDNDSTVDAWMTPDFGA
jgi:hypothetical protein